MCQNQLNHCCFTCKHYYHANPDDDKCDIDNHIVYYDSHICENYVRG